MWRNNIASERDEEIEIKTQKIPKTKNQKQTLVWKFILFFSLKWRKKRKERESVLLDHLLVPSVGPSYSRTPIVIRA